MRIPTKEELKLFRDAMSDVRPLDGADRAVQPRPPVRKRKPPALTRPPARTSSSRSAEPRIDATLDLHGYTAEAARRRLQEFIADARARGFQRVRIVHGKGLRSGAAGPVLRSVVEHTLRSLDEVETLEPARAADGGAGAAVALLRDAGRRQRRR